MIKNRRIFFIVGGVLLLIAIGVFVACNTKQIFSMFGVSPKVPTFSFNQTAASGWWNTDNYNNQASVETPYKGDVPIAKLPVAYMSIFKGVKGDGATACFVIYSYYDYPADAAAVSNQQKPSTSADITVQQLDDADVSMHTPDGIKSFTLHKYATSGPGSVNTMRGTSYGLVKLGEGYITISGVCPTGDELDSTILAMKAVSLDK